LTDIPDIRTESFWIGNSVAISGNRIAVGAPGHRLNVGPMGGAVVMLERHEGEWQYKELVVMPDGAEGDRFGEAIALRENTLVVGAPEKNYSESIREAGAAYVFHFDAYQWQFERKFTSMDHRKKSVTLMWTENQEWHITRFYERGRIFDG
jgi:hypothetical protein